MTFDGNTFSTIRITEGEDQWDRTVTPEWTGDIESYCDAIEAQLQRPSVRGAYAEVDSGEIPDSIELGIYLDDEDGDNVAYFAINAKLFA